MKKNYYLFMLLTFLTVNISNAQGCPELLGAQTTTTTIHFRITPGFCDSYPLRIFIAYQGYSESFIKTSCTGSNLKYTSEGSPLPVADSFSSFIPGVGTCNYVNGSLVTLSDEEVSFNDKVLIYPNPVTHADRFTIKFKSSLSAKLEIYNVTGKLVFSDMVSNQDRKEVKTSQLSNGIYMLKIATEDASTTRKVVIMN